MDNKLTKKRLSDFLAYEWILTIIIAVAAIVVWELAYTMSAVRLTTGQAFKYYYDENVTAVDDGRFYDMLKESGTFSYDVKELTSETLTSSYNVLSTRLSVYEGDVIFTDCTEKEDGSVRAKNLADTYGYNYERLLSDAKNYLAGFLKDGVTGEWDMLDYENLDESKIEAHFGERSGKRVYKNSLKAGEISVADEKERIKKLCSETADFKKLLECDAENLFFRYTRFEQSLAFAEERDKPNYEKAVNSEKDAGRENAVYGLNLAALKCYGGDTTGKKEVTDIVKYVGTAEADGVTLLVFDFKSEQPDLQYEAIAFINAVVRACSDII